ncbi:MAG: hypothetical protein C4519_04485 [Desulfobacteraceae bacterium]|nr:MAG: hypothetical protein C4519_04485 [Desulfobacteraceae bacterium]
MEMASNKKILLISYHFPPSAAVGGLRAANFARYISGFGWTPYILTIDQKYLSNPDFGRLKDLEGIQINRSLKLPKLFDAVVFLLKKVKSIKAGIKRRPHVLPKMDAGRGSGEKTSSPESVRARFIRYYASLFLALPDYERNWVLPAVLKAVGIIKKEKIDWVLTSCPPYSVHLIGWLVELLTGVRWVADFRDPWFVASQKRMYPTCKLSRAIEGVCEKRIMQRAKVIVTNTQRLCRTFKEAYPGVHAEKIVHIPNGISKTAFQALDGLPKFDQFTMTYAGSLYFYRTPEPIFRAVRELIDARRVKAADLRIKLIGNCSHVDGFPTADIIASYGLDGIVDVLPPIPYQEVLKVLKKSQLALLFAPDQPYQIPAKVYDYIGTGTKILAIANEGATSELIDATASGKSFLPEDISGIREYIAEGVQAGMINGWTIDRHPELLDAYDYSNITHRLAKVLTEKC